MVQREVAWRDDRGVTRLLKAAQLKVSTACVQDINWRASLSLRLELPVDPIQRARRFGSNSPPSTALDDGDERQAVTSTTC
jgi:hypothetical protein